MSSRPLTKRTWCVLRSSEELRRALLYRMKQRGERLVDIHKNTGVSPKKISRWKHQYINAISQADLVTLADYFDIGIELKVTFK